MPADKAHQAVMKTIKDKDVKFVDLRFTDPRGKWQHVSFDAGMADADFFEKGVMFDGSSIAGWKAINESDMTLMPDPSTAQLDPFCAQTTLSIICDINEPSTGQAYSRDPRQVARRAEIYLQQSGQGDQVFIGPEAEFFVFDDVRFKTDPYQTGFRLDSTELPVNSNRRYSMGNMGHRPRTKGGYFPVAPVDSAQDLRSEMLAMMQEMGITIEKHHHEVGAAQHELGFKYAPLLEAADKIQIYKYVVHNVAHSFGKTATFMPKPVMGDNGTGMHVHQSIWNKKKPVFAGNGYADLSETCLFYIGGIIRHAKAINAFSNPTTNSYKRLVPGYEAPVLLAYSARNRSASCRIPFAPEAGGKRVEVRFPDPSANPYLAFSAMLMAGLDGIENRIHPGDPMDKDLYDLPPEEEKSIPTIAANLEEACQQLNEDRDFLKKGDVFSDDLIDGYLELKQEEIERLAQTPHPVEFDMYYSV